MNKLLFFLIIFPLFSSSINASRSFGRAVSDGAAAAAAVAGRGSGSGPGALASGASGEKGALHQRVSYIQFSPREYDNPPSSSLPSAHKRGRTLTSPSGKKPRIVDLSPGKAGRAVVTSSDDSAEEVTSEAWARAAQELERKRVRKANRAQRKELVAQIDVAREHMDKREFESAKDILENVLGSEHFPLLSTREKAYVYADTGGLAWTSKDYETAYNRYHSILEGSAPFSKHLDTMEHFQLRVRHAELSRRRGTPDVARQYEGLAKHRRSLKKLPRAERAMFEVGRADLLLKAEKTDEAIRTLQSIKAGDLDAIGKREYYRSLGKAHYHAGRYKDAVDAYITARRIDAPVSTRREIWEEALVYADALKYMGRSNDAADVLGLLLRDTQYHRDYGPLYLDRYLEYAELRLASGKYEQAGEAYKNLKKEVVFPMLNPDSKIAVELGYSEVLMHQGKLADARPYFDRLWLRRRLSDLGDPETQANFLYNYVLVLDKQKAPVTRIQEILGKLSDSAFREVLDDEQLKMIEGISGKLSKR